MENIIKLKRLTFFEDMGMLSKTITKLHCLTSIKAQLVKLIMIQIDPQDVACITSRVEVAIKTKPAQDKDFVNNEKLVRDLISDYVISCSQLTFEADKE